MSLYNNRKMAITFFRRTYKRLIEPRSKNPDEQRREFIVNILLGLFTGAALVAMISSVANHLTGHAVNQGNSLDTTALFLIVVSGLWWISRRGAYKVGAYVLIALVWLASMQLMLGFSFELPMAQLLTVLAIVLAGIILNPRPAFLFTILVAVTTIAIGYAQATELAAANTQWLSEVPDFSDAVGTAILFVIIGTISWLSNKEIDRLLKRAWRSEAALAKQRDQLEITVAKRTQQLENAQLDRTLQLQRFVEFGRISSSLMHDLANPLTAASLHLEQAGATKESEQVSHALVSLRHIENYITTARKQLQNKRDNQLFDVGTEINQVIELLSNQATTAEVAIESTIPDKCTMYGDPAILHQVMSNLILNAIQAYSSRKTAQQRVVIVAADQNHARLQITVKDFGSGIKSTDLPHIFEEFYSTKKEVGRGLGIGLSSVKYAVEEYFNGSITAKSSSKAGTIFTLHIPLHEKVRTKRSRTRAQAARKKAASRR